MSLVNEEELQSWLRSHAVANPRPERAPVVSVSHRASEVRFVRSERRADRTCPCGRPHLKLVRAGVDRRQERAASGRVSAGAVCCQAT